MFEMRNVAEQEEPEIEPRSRTVSFPDHYLVPYIEMCKGSKLMTCVWSIIWIGLAIFFFFATNYMINYPVTEARKIACVFGGVFCLVAAAGCLKWRFRLSQLSSDNVQFEIVARQDVEFSDSFSGHFEMQEPTFFHGTPTEGPSQTEMPEDSFILAHTIDDPCSGDISTIRSNGHAPSRKLSISEDMTQESPLLQRRKPLSFSMPSWVKNGIGSSRLRNFETVSGNNKYPPNYSSFENGCETPDTEPLLAESTSQNGSD